MAALIKTLATNIAGIGTGGVALAGKTLKGLGKGAYHAVKNNNRSWRNSGKRVLNAGQQVVVRPLDVKAPDGTIGGYKKRRKTRKNKRKIRKTKRKIRKTKTKTRRKTKRKTRRKTRRKTKILHRGGMAQPGLTGKFLSEAGSLIGEVLQKGEEGAAASATAALALGSKGLQAAGERLGDTGQLATQESLNSLSDSVKAARAATLAAREAGKETVATAEATEAGFNEAGKLVYTLPEAVVGTDNSNKELDPYYES